MFFPWKQHQPANTQGSILAFPPPWRQQGYPGNRLLHSPILRFLGSVAEAVVELLGRESLWWDHAAWLSSAQEGSSRGGGGSFSSIVLCHISLSCLAPSATSNSYLLSRTWSLPLSSARSSVPSSLPAPRSAFIFVTPHAYTLSISHHTPTQLISFTHFKINMLKRVRKNEQPELVMFGGSGTRICRAFPSISQTHHPDRRDSPFHSTLTEHCKAHSHIHRLNVVHLCAAFWRPVSEGLHVSFFPFQL